MADLSVPSLVRLLSSGQPDGQLAAAMQLVRLTVSNQANRRRAVQAGVLPPLLQMVGSGKEALQLTAAAALSNIVHSYPSVADVAGACIPALVGLLQTSPSSAVGPAAGLLQQLAWHSPERQQAISAAGGVIPLLDLCWRSTGVTQEAAAGALCNMTAQPAAVAQLLAAGRIADVVLLLQPGAASTPNALEAATLALRNLMTNSAEATEAAIAAGAAAALVEMMRSSGSAKLQQAAIQALVQLATDKEPPVVAAVAADAIPALAEQLWRSDNSLVLHAALELLLLFTAHGTAPDRCRDVAATGCIPRVVRLLDGSAGEESTDVAARLLQNISSTDDPSISDAMVAAGAVPALVAVLRAADSSSDTLVSAVDALQNLRLDGHKPALLAAGAASALQPLRSWPNPAVQLAAANQLARLQDRAPTAVLRGTVQVMDGSDPGGTSTFVQTGPLQPAAASSAASAAPAAPPQPQPQQRPPRVCAAPGCGVTRGLRRCGGCRSVRYCSEACCRAHWQAHKAECRRLQAQRAAADSKD